MTKNNTSPLLIESCYEVARTTMWERKPVDTKQIQEHANKLHEQALIVHGIVEDLGCDIPMLIRAVDYLHQTQAIPPMGDNTQWFYDSLIVILEVACPNRGVDGNAKNFLLDMKNGINQLLQE